MKIASRPPLRRILALDGMLRAGRYPNAVTAAAELDVNSRTIHRDLDFLRDSWGAPLEFCRKHNGWYYRDPDYAFPLLRLTEGEPGEKGHAESSKDIKHVSVCALFSTP